MDRKYDLPEKIKNEIAEYAEKYGVTKVILFGSRARGTNRERSDIDIAVSGGDFIEFSYAMDEEVRTLLMFDVVNLDTCRSEELLSEIKRDGVVIYEKADTGLAAASMASMQIKKCTEQDIPELAAMNKQLIEDEKSDNPMSITELENRMRGFLSGEYEAYFFLNENNIAGYALVKNNCTPPYLRQFFICRKFRRMHLGSEAFKLLLEAVGTDIVDIEVLPWNEVGIKFWEKLGFKEISRYMRYSK